MADKLAVLPILANSDERPRRFSVRVSTAAYIALFVFNAVGAGAYLNAKAWAEEFVVDCQVEPNGVAERRDLDGDVVRQRLRELSGLQHGALLRSRLHRKSAVLDHVKVVQAAVRPCYVPTSFPSSQASERLWRYRPDMLR